MLAQTPGATTPGKRPFFIKTDMDLSSILINFNLHPLYPGKQLIFTDMDREDESPKPEPSRDYKDAQPSNDFDAVFKSHLSNFARLFACLTPVFLLKKRPPFAHLFVKMSASEE